MSADFPVLEFQDQPAWSAWLDQHHAASSGIWLRIAKKAAGTPSLSYAQALEEALRYGWIDGQKGKGDDKSWLQKFTPRSKKSIWSKINREKALALIEAGRMHAAGLAEVERARKDGRWERAYDSPAAADVPEDFRAALDKNLTAKAAFDEIDRANRYAFLFRIQTAKKPETRARRIEQFVGMLERNEKIHPR